MISEKERLQYFLTVAQLGGVQPASKVLGAKTSHILRKVHSLEEEYGTKFFSRNYRGLDLTNEGKQFYDLAQNIVSEIVDFESKIKNKITSDEESKSLKISSTIGIISEWIAPNIPEFLSLNPGISIVVNVELREMNLNLVDLCLSTKLPEQPDLIQKKIRTCTFRLYATKSYIEKHGRPKSPKDLDNHQLIFFAGEDRLLIRESDNLFQLESNGKTRKPNIVINSALAELQVMLNGGGIACVSIDWPEIKGENIVDLFPNLEKKIDIYAIYKKDNQNTLISPFLRLLLDKNKRAHVAEAQ